MAEHSAQSLETWMDQVGRQVVEHKQNRHIDKLTSWLHELTIDTPSFPQAVPPSFLARLHNELGLCLFSQDRYEEAAAALRLAMELDPDNANAAYNLGDLYLSMERTEEAMALFAALLVKTPNHAGALYQTGLHHLGKGRTEHALDCFFLCREHAPNFPGGHFWIAECLLNTGDVAQALASFEQTHTLSPEHDASLRGMAACCLRLGRFEDAVAHCDALLRQDTEGQLVAMQIRGDALLRLERVAEAAFCHAGLALLEFDAREFVVNTARRLAEHEPHMAADYASVILREIPELEGALGSLAAQAPQATTA